MHIMSRVAKCTTTRLYGVRWSSEDMVWLIGSTNRYCTCLLRRLVLVTKLIATRHRSTCKGKENSDTEHRTTRILLQCG